MRDPRVWVVLLGIDRAVVERVDYDQAAGVVVAHVRPVARSRGLCGQCGRRCPGYDQGEGRRRWRTLDLGAVRTFLEADAPRLLCPEHGVVVAAVPWARHGAGHTRPFDDLIAWLVVRCSKSAVRQLMRIAWATVGSILTRVQADIDTSVDRLAGLRRIGIDEVSYKKGWRYLTVVVDHDTGRLVWAAPGANKATLQGFFALLGQRCALLTQVSADSAPWIAAVVAACCPAAVRCADPFHVVKWANDALDLVRRRAWNLARNKPGGRGRDRYGRPDQAVGDARTISRSRWSLWRNPEDLTDRQRAKLEWIAKAEPVLYRAYLLKEGLRSVFAVSGEQGKRALGRWLTWAARCRIPEFVRLGHKIRRELAAIHATLDHRLSNGLVESVNTKIRLLTRIAFGFRNPESLIALAMLALGGHRPMLPCR